MIDLTAVGRCAAAAALAVCFTALAAPGARATDNVAEPAGAEAAASEGPSSQASSRSGARASAFVDKDGTFVFSEGFKSLRRPLTGVYCLKPSAGANLNLKKITPAITVEWGTSAGSNLSAYYNRSNSNCNTNEIEVLTFTFPSGGGNTFSDSVSFTISVP